MTVNERLYEARLLDDFYIAASKKDRAGMITLLISVEIEEAEAEATADSILNNQAFT